jgi:hypothetical protein
VVVVVEDDSDDYGPFKQTSSSPLNQSSNVGYRRFVPTHQVQTPAHSQVGAPYSDAGARSHHQMWVSWEERIPMQVARQRSDVGVYSNVGAKYDVAIASDVGVASDGGGNFKCWPSSNRHYMGKLRRTSLAQRAQVQRAAEAQQEIENEEDAKSVADFKRAWERRHEADADEAGCGTSD